MITIIHAFPPLSLDLTSLHDEIHYLFAFCLPLLRLRRLRVKPPRAHGSVYKFFSIIIVTNNPAESQ